MALSSKSMNAIMLWKLFIPYFLIALTALSYYVLIENAAMGEWTLFQLEIGYFLTFGVPWILSGLAAFFAIRVLYDHALSKAARATGLVGAVLSVGIFVICCVLAALTLFQS